MHVKQKVHCQAHTKFSMSVTIYHYHWPRVIIHFANKQICHWAHFGSTLLSRGAHPWPPLLTIQNSLCILSNNILWLRAWVWLSSIIHIHLWWQLLFWESQIWKFGDMDLFKIWWKQNEMIWMDVQDILLSNKNQIVVCIYVCAHMPVFWNNLY